MTRKLYINEKEVAELTGLSLSTLRNSRCQGTLFAYYKVGKSVRYSMDEIKDYMEAHRINATSKRDAYPPRER